MNVRLTVALAATVLSLSACGAAAEGYRAGVGDPPPASQSCLDAITAAEEAFAIVVESGGITVEWIQRTPTPDEIDRLSDLTEDLGPVVQEFNTTKTECRGE